MNSVIKTVLIIDDSPEDRQIYSYYLRNEFAVLEAGLGAEALAMIREKRPDCVLLDYSLPDMNGLQVLESLHADSTLATVAVILLTGYGDVRVAVSAMRAGALDFLDKADVGAENLRRAVGHAIEKSQLRSELNRQREWLRVTLASIHNGILSVDTEARITVMNEAAASLTGWALDQAMGQDLATILRLRDEQPEFDWRHELTRLMSSITVPGHHQGSGWMMDRIGREFPVEYSLTAVHSPDGVIDGLVVSLQDVTQRRLAEETLIEAKNAAEVANRAKSEFLAHMSHEFRTPLNAVLGMAQLMQFGELEPDQQEMVEQIHHGGRTLLNLVDDLLDFSELKTAAAEMTEEPFLLAQLMDQLTQLLGNIARDKGLDLQIETPEDVQGPWLGDALRLGQVLMNLTANAIKFTEKGAIQIRVSSTNPSGLHFEVRDTGIGMNAETLLDIFKPFAQADSSLTRRYGGTGLGLSISTYLVECMHGRMGVESTPGVGSVFWFEVPLTRLSTPVPKVA